VNSTLPLLARFHFEGFFDKRSSSPRYAVASQIHIGSPGDVSLRIRELGKGLSSLVRHGRWDPGGYQFRGEILWKILVEFDGCIRLVAGFRESASNFRVVSTRLKPPEARHDLLVA
jgi:hypothetical protein